MISPLPEIDFNKIKKSEYQLNMESNGFGLISIIQEIANI